MGLAQPSETYWLTGTGPGLDHQEVVNRVVWMGLKPNRTVFLVLTWIAGRLPGHIANSTNW